jgi:TonB-dependent SusC/RagA subfamily outer membrane receptor
MPLVILYLLKSSISLSIVWIFYQLLLRRLTFYRLNRWYLLGYSLLSFLIPLINIGPMLDEDFSRPPAVIEFIPVIGDYGIAGGGAGVAAVAGPSASGSRWNLLLIFFAAGAVLLLIRCIVRWHSLRGVRRQARLIGDDGIKIYQVDEPIIPFSFGNAVYINRHLHSEKEWEEIILHEYVHIRQRHTADILLAELFCVVNWYNPFAWLIRYSIRQNLEFIADGKVLENGFDKKSYQYHLLKVIGEPRYRLANNFNLNWTKSSCTGSVQILMELAQKIIFRKIFGPIQSSLKKRIIMMNKIRSARLHVLKFLFILPLIAVLLVAFRDKYDGIFRRPGQRYINAVGIVADYPTRQPLAGVLVLDKISGMTTATDAKGYYHLRIPAAKDSITVRIEYRKEGYSTDWSGHFLPAVKGSVGLIDIGLLVSKGDGAHFMMKPPYFKKAPEDPSYDDALAALEDVFQGVLDMNRFGEMRTGHPEVALFYTTEDKEHQIVVLNSGEVEKYGYPGGPGVAEMEKKYGSLPEMMTANTAMVGKGYLSEWKRIAEEAEKEFRASGTSARHILFPGDSRVIVVPVSGKPEVYDMDNNNVKERPAFEKRYGKLPDCVPAPGFSLPAPVARPVSGPAAAAPAPVPAAPSVVSAAGPAPRVSAPDTIPAGVLYVVDGTEITQEDWASNRISPNMIYSISILKGQSARDAYGERGAGGVVCITTKSFFERFTRMHTIDIEHPLQTPLYYLDGVQISKNALDTLNPEEIGSIDVLKGRDAKRLYGERGIDGVLLIHTRNKTTLRGQPWVNMDKNEGKITMQADSITVKPVGDHGL